MIFAPVFAVGLLLGEGLSLTGVAVSRALGIGLISLGISAWETASQKTYHAPRVGSALTQNLREHCDVARTVRPVGYPSDKTTTGERKKRMRTGRKKLMRTMIAIVCVAAVLGGIQAHPQEDGKYFQS